MEVFAALLGWRFYGVDGACIAAGAVWLLGALFGAAVDWHSQQRMQRFEALLMQTAGDVQAVTKEVHGMRDDVRKVWQSVWHN